MCFKIGEESVVMKVLGMTFQTLLSMALKDLHVINITLILGTFGGPDLVSLRVREGITDTL